MKKITLSADEDLIARARKRAHTENTTLNNLFREWLAGYAAQSSLSAGDIRRVSQTVEHFRAGQRFTREERNER